MYLAVDRRSCHSGVMTAAGWIIPVDKLIETGQIKIRGCNSYYHIGTSLNCIESAQLASRIILNAHCYYI